MPLRGRNAAFLGVVLAISLFGCGGQQLSQGEPNFNTGILLSDPAAAARNATALGLTPKEAPKECDVPSTATQDQVRACVYAVKALIDDQYREYRITLHHFADQGNAAADITVLGLTTAATGPISSVAKTVLSGLGTIVGGSKSILNQDLLYKQTIEIVISQMDADRDRRFTLMLKEMSGSNYTLGAAKDDLLAYFAAGTWDNALTTLQSKVAANQANCQVEINAAKLKSSQGNGGTPPSAISSFACPTAVSPPNANIGVITPSSATAGSTFKAADGVGIYKVVTPASSPTADIVVSYARDGKNYVAKPPMPFSEFLKLVEPPAPKTP